MEGWRGQGFRFGHRVLEFAARLTVASHNMGVGDALGTLVFGRRSGEERSVQLRGLRRPFQFRGRTDFGVLSHFFRPGLHIRDSGSTQRVTRIIDAGAHIGDETVRYLHNHPEAQVVAVEADSANYRLLQTNVRDPRAHLRHAALWSGAGIVEVRTGGSREETRVQKLTTGHCQVPSVSVSQLMAEMGWTEVDILKLDIEGAEREVFTQGPSEWMRKVRVFVFECPDYEEPGCTQLIFERLSSNGVAVRTYVHGENLVLIRDDVSWSVESQLWY